MSKKTIAIGTDGAVRLWCTGTAARFSVINGLWDGRIKDGQVYVLGRSKDPAGPGEILWEGVVPREHGFDYNDAIPWIQGEVDRLASERLL